MGYWKLEKLLIALFLLFCLSGPGVSTGSAEESLSSAVPVDFDVLKRAQKDIQKDLGLPDHSDSGLIENQTTRNPDTAGLDEHPVLISFLLFALGLGIVLLGWVIRNEQKKEESLPLETHASTGIDDGLEPEKSSPQPVFPTTRSKRKIRTNLLASESARSPGTFFSYVERLDLFLESLREASDSPEASCVALYHLRSNSAFHTLLSRSSGTGFPRFFHPSLLNESSQKLVMRIREEGGEKEQGALGMTTAIDGNIESLCILFFDQRGVSYLIHFSETKKERPGKWFRSVSQNHGELLSSLESYLKDYSRFHYQIPEDTFDGYGVLDGRGFENRLFQELERADRLKTETLLFVFSVKNTNSQEVSFEKEEEFMERFQRLVSLEIRNGDSLTRAGDGHLFLLLPETLEADASIVSRRIRKIFESTKAEMHEKDLALDSRELSMHGTEKEKLFEFLSTI